MLIATQHGHLRPDMVWDTGVIEPYPIAFRNPVDVARRTINPFIRGIRGGRGVVVAVPTPEDVARTAAAVSVEFAQGRAATINLGGKAVKVDASSRPRNPIVATVVEAARRVASGQEVTVTGQGRAVKIKPPAQPQSGGGTMGMPFLPQGVVTAGTHAVVTRAADPWAAARSRVEAEQARAASIVAYWSSGVPGQPASPGRQAIDAALANRQFLESGAAPTTWDRSREAQVAAARRAMAGR